MKQIDKDALVAEIESLKADALQKKSQCKRSGLERIMHQIGAYNKILSFINTLEVKEVDSNDAFIKKACDWLRTHSEADYFELIPDANYCGAGNLNKKKMIEDFKKYMED